MPAFELITFDVFTALFDIRASLLPRLIRLLPEHIHAAALLQDWRACQMEYALISNSLPGERIPFNTITARSLAFALQRAGCELAPAAQQSLIDGWQSLQLWPEARQVLKSLEQRGQRLALLSNGDQQTLDALAKLLPVQVAAVFSCQTAGFYKPHPEIYRLPGKRLGLPHHHILHVAGSATDVIGARSAGLPCYWSNRHGASLIDPGCQPTFESHNLLGLLDRL